VSSVKRLSSKEHHSIDQISSDQISSLINKMENRVKSVVNKIFSSFAHKQNPLSSKTTLDRKILDQKKYSTSIFTKNNLKKVAFCCFLAYMGYLAYNSGIFLIARNELKQTPNLDAEMNKEEIAQCINDVDSDVSFLSSYLSSYRVFSCEGPQFSKYFSFFSTDEDNCRVLKTCYRKMARDFHPDSNRFNNPNSLELPIAREAFSRINNAYVTMKEYYSCK